MTKQQLLLFNNNMFKRVLFTSCATGGFAYYGQLVHVPNTAIKLLNDLATSISMYL